MKLFGNIPNISLHQVSPAKKRFVLESCIYAASAPAGQERFALKSSTGFSTY